MPVQQSVSIDIGIPENDRKEIAKGLCRFMADTYTLYLKTHNFHWNVTGPMFQTLHLMFETQYQELWMAVDEIAERIRALGAFAPGTGEEISALTSIKEEKGDIRAQEMIRLLVDGHEAVSRTARITYQVAEKVKDQATVDLLTRRMHIHEKYAWMLRS